VCVCVTVCALWLEGKRTNVVGRDGSLGNSQCDRRRRRKNHNFFLVRFLLDRKLKNNVLCASC
jgi:hypothetical protein